MKLSVLIKCLAQIQVQHGDIECELQDEPGRGEQVTAYPDFFVVPEEYEEGWRVSLRWWPY